MEVPDEDTTAGQLLSSKSSIGRKDYESASAGDETTAADTAAAEAAEEPTQAEAAEEPTQAEAAEEPTQAEAAEGPTQAEAAEGPTQAEAAEEPTEAEAAEGPTQAETEAAKPSAANGPRPAAPAGDKKIPPGAVRMLSMTTVEEFQKKVAERKGRMSRVE